MAGRLHPYDLDLDGQGYVVLRDKNGVPSWKVTPIAAEMGQQPTVDDVPATHTDWHLGFGYTESRVPGAYGDSEGGLDARWPGDIIMGPLVTALTIGGTTHISDFFEENSKWYVLAGRYCKRLDVTDDSVEAPNDGADGKDFGAGAVATKAADFDGKTYVGFSTNTAIYEFDGTTWDNADPDGGATAVRAVYWAKDYLDTYGWRLWRGYGTNSVSGCPTGSDPLDDASWSTAFSVGDTAHTITGMAATRQSIWVAKTNGLYPLDWTGRAENALERAEALVDSANGKNLLLDGEAVLYPHVMGLLEYDPSGAVTTIHPAAMTGYQGSVRGTVTAQCLAGPWHYIALYNGSDTYLLAGRYPQQGESLPAGFVGPKIWHPLVKLTGRQCWALKLCGLTTPPRLYFGYGTTDAYDAAYIRVPKSGNVIGEMGTTNLTFAASGQIDFCPDDWGAPGAAKVLAGIELENEAFGATAYADLYEKVDGGAFVYVGRAQVPGRSSLYIPIGNWRGHRATVRLVLTNGSSTSTPRVKAVVAKAVVRPTTRELIQTTVLCGDGVKRLDGQPERVSGETLLAHLKSHQEGEAVSLYDWLTGSRRHRRVLVMPVGEQVSWQQGTDPAAYVANLTLVVTRELPAEWKWDDGSLWDSGVKWG